MATTTRAVLRQRLSEALGDWWQSTASGNGTSTTLVDTTLAGLVDSDDSVPNWYVYPTAGTAGNIGVLRRVKLTGGYTASSTTLTVSRAWASSTATSDTYELHRIDPTAMHNALNRASEILFPQLFLPVRDETLVVDNFLSNGDFDTISAGDATGWTRVNSPTLTAETTIMAHRNVVGAQAAKVVAGGSVGQMYQAGPPVNSQLNKTVRFKCWTYATAASTVRIGISTDGGSTITYSDTYNTGNSQWEYLSVSVAVPSSGFVSIRCYLEVAANGTGYFDACYAALTPVYEYTMPTSIINYPHSVKMQYIEVNPDSEYGPTQYWYEGRRLRIEGMGLLTLPSSDTGTMEISGKQVDLLVARSAQWLSAMLASAPGGSLRDIYKAEEQRWAGEVAMLLRDKNTWTPRLLAQDRNGNKRGEWDVISDGTTRKLVLHGFRG